MWIAAGSGIAIFSLVLGANFVGDGLRDVLDPRTRAGSRAGDGRRIRGAPSALDRLASYLPVPATHRGTHLTHITSRHPRHAWQTSLPMRYWMRYYDAIV